MPNNSVEELCRKNKRGRGWSTSGTYGYTSGTTEITECRKIKHHVFQYPPWCQVWGFPTVIWVSPVNSLEEPS